MLFIPLLLGVCSFAAAVPRPVASGDSVLGTLDAPYLPHFLQDDLKRNEYPPGWDDASGPAPLTGKTRYYDLTLTRTDGAPDGVNKSLILINNQFPGPTIEANWGDTIQVKVTNKIADPDEGTTLHWHGFFQRGTPWSDGTPGVSQCPIAPGDTFTYVFNATQYGTSWYHSHLTAQYMDGAFGAVVVYGPADAKYDVDVGPVLINDWAHAPSYFAHLVGVFSQPPSALPADNNLINGKNPFNCSLKTNDTNATCTPAAGGLSKFQFQDGKTHRLRLINAGRQGNEKFSIDGHELEVIANDFVPIKPYTTNVVTLGVGQRSDVLVRGKNEPRGAYWMRADMDPSCLNLTSYQPNAKAAVYYPQANTNQPPEHNNPAPWSSNACKNDPLSKTQPLYPQAAVTSPEFTRTVDMRIAKNSTGFLLFVMNNSSAVMDFNDPMLPHAATGNYNYPSARNVFDMQGAKSARIIFRNYNPYIHPMHLHGHNFQVLAEGTGEWDGTITNPSNPQRRDTHLMPPGTDTEPVYTVIQWTSDNPGMWPLHCHLLIHSNPGLTMNMLEQGHQIPALKAPNRMQEVCKNWDQFTKNHVVNQISAGFKALAERE